MRTARSFNSLSLLLALALLSPPGAAALATTETLTITSAQDQQQQMGALQRGYRTGYSDGYQAGWGDVTARAPRDFRNKEDYQNADRAYAPAHGSLEDYRDGYQQGFESGYGSGYGKRLFDSTVPATLARRGGGGSGTRTQTSTGGINRDAVDADESASRSTGSSARVGAGRPANVIPAETVMRVELLNRLSSDVSQRGDRFEARVVEPAEYVGAEVGGVVSRVARPGKARGTAELQLAFDQIRWNNGAWEDFSAQVIEVVPSGGEDGAGDVDEEGGVRGRSSRKEDAAKVGAGAGIGAIIGAIAGGGKGAAIGAAIGGGAGAGRVLTQRGREIRLEPGQQMVIRTSRSFRSN